jgi:hypothetical protein
MCPNPASPEDGGMTLQSRAGRLCPAASDPQRWAKPLDGMRFALSFLAISFLLVACSDRSTPPQVQHDAPTSIPSDSELNAILPGTWVLEQDWPASHSNMRSVVTVASNGAYVCHITGVTLSRTNAIDLEGTWQIKDGCLIDTITKDSDPGFNPPRHALPYTSTQRIMRANEKELALGGSRIFRKERN